MRLYPQIFKPVSCSESDLMK